MPHYKRRKFTVVEWKRAIAGMHIKCPEALSWPQTLSLCWLTTVAVVALLGIWLETGWAPQALTEGLSPSGETGQAWTWWLSATRNSAVGVLVVVGTSLVLGISAASAGAYGPWWVGAGLTRALELTGALPNIILVGLWLVTHPEDALAAVVVVVAIQRTLEVASVAWLALRTLDNQRMNAAALGFISLRTLHRPLLPHLRPLMATSAAHGAASLFALQAAVVYLDLAPSHDSTWASLLGRAARDPKGTEWVLIAAAAFCTCTVTLSLFAVAAGQARPPAPESRTPLGSPPPNATDAGRETTATPAAL